MPTTAEPLKVAEPKAPVPLQEPAPAVPTTAEVPKVVEPEAPAPLQEPVPSEPPVDENAKTLPAAYIKSAKKASVYAVKSSLCTGAYDIFFHL